MVLTRDAVGRWVDAYERAWRADDVDAVEALFTADAAYRSSPYEASEVGHDAIKASWLQDTGRRFSMSAEVVAVDGDTAVVRVDVSYESPQHQEYRDVWLLRFGPDGRVADFEEWAYWPGRPYTAAGDPS